MSIDEQPHTADLARGSLCKQAFAENGTIIPVDSNSISDGTSALLLARAEALSKYGLTPIGRLVAHSRKSLPTEEFMLAPIGALTKVLAKAGWSPAMVDLWAINEAFALVTMLTTRALELDPEVLNIHGREFSEGHPIGSTSSRIIVTLLHALTHYGKHRGVAALV